MYSAENISDISSCTVTIEGEYTLIHDTLSKYKFIQIARKDLLALDFEGILNYFRVSLPKKFQSEDDCQLLFDTMFSFKVTEKKLTKLQKDYQSYLEQQAQLEDPVMRLERDNKALRDTIHRLEQENDNLAQDLVGSKIKLRGDMDKVGAVFYVLQL